MLPSGRSVSGRGFVTGHRWSCGDGSRLLAPLATKIVSLAVTGSLTRQRDATRGRCIDPRHLYLYQICEPHEASDLSHTRRRQPDSGGVLQWAT